MLNILAGLRPHCVYCGCMYFAFPILDWSIVLASTVAGLVFGSFLNVCIVRLPAHQSIITPRSHCRACGRRIFALDNIPLISWVLLGGRCRRCKAAISLQYPLVELGTALLFAGCVLHTGITWQTLIDAVACFFLLGLALMDAQTMLLPDSFTLTGLAAAFILKGAAAGAGQRAHMLWRTLEDTFASAALLLLVYATYWIVRRRHGVGMGDVKLMAMMAAFIGLPLTLFAYFVGVLSGAGFAAALVARDKVRGTDKIPFGSFLAAAGILAVFTGKSILAWYLSLYH